MSLRDRRLNEDALECAEGVVVAERYRLVRKLGAGGMGSVWLAHDRSLDSSCAVKLIDEEKSQSEEVRVRFEREARAAAQLRGAHVVDVFDHGESNGLLYIAMEYLEGEDLGARLDRTGALSTEEAYRVVAHVARALARAHANGIVHRDLKPENVFLVQEDEGEIAKVLDFGIAKHDAYSIQDKATRTGSFLGTPYYVSPEQARGKSTDHRSDLWSLGIIAFQCLTGRPPFESDALGELMGLILYEDLPRPTFKNPKLPLPVDVWWEKAAARDREQRFQSAKEMADAFGLALGVTKLISVPTVVPRRPSYADGSGAYPSASVSGRFPPVAGLPHDLMQSALQGAGSQPLADAGTGEELIETDAPVSRTRHSGMVVIRRLSARSSRWLSRLKDQRKRTLVGAAVGSGLALGILLTLFWVSGDSTEELDDVRAAHSTAPSVEANAPASGAEANEPAHPEPSVTLKSVPIEALPQDTDPAAQESDDVTSTRKQDGKAQGPGNAASVTPPQSVREPQRRPTPPPKKRVRGPDYGI